MKKLKEEYGKMAVMTIMHHTYCEKNFIFNDRAVIIDMSDYIKEKINKIPDQCTKSAATRATVYLFDINPSQVKLDEDKKKIFQRLA